MIQFILNNFLYETISSNRTLSDVQYTQYMLFKEQTETTSLYVTMLTFYFITCLTNTNFINIKCISFSDSVPLHCSLAVELLEKTLYCYVTKIIK